MDRSRRLRVGVWLTLFLLAFVEPAPTTGQPQSSTEPTSKDPLADRRGAAGDWVADRVLGQPDFLQGIPKEIVAFKVAGPGGVLVDRSTDPDRVYVYDGMNSRVLGYSALGVCRDDVEIPCSASGECPSGECRIQLAGRESSRLPDIVLGQPDFSRGACNGDGTRAHYPGRAVASAASLCTMPPGAVSPYEDGSFAAMAVDANGRLYVPDYHNNRVLAYDRPFETDTVADAIWGQPDFEGNACNRGLPIGPDTLCFPHSTPRVPATAAALIDPEGNLWVADAGNHRVLRFPRRGERIEPSADLALGQPDLFSGQPGSALNQLRVPTGVHVTDQGQVLVTDSENDRVVVYAPPLRTGMTGALFPYPFRLPVGITADVPQPDDPASGGLWIGDSLNNQLLLFDGPTTSSAARVKKVLFKDIARDDGLCGGPYRCPSTDVAHACTVCFSRGAVGVTDSGDVIAPSSISIQDVFYFRRPIATPTEGLAIPAVARFYHPPYRHNYLSDRGMLRPMGVLRSATQLIVADAHRLVYWNLAQGIEALESGQAYDGVAGVPDWVSEAQPFYTRIASDGNETLWALRRDRIDVFDLPLDFGELPVTTFDSSDFVLLGSEVPIGRPFEISGITLDPGRKHLWLASPTTDRVMRLRLPDAPGRAPTIEVLIGGSEIPQERRGWHRSCPPATELCAPGAVTMDAEDRLVISDYYLENEGSGRLLVFEGSALSLDSSSLAHHLATEASIIRHGEQAWQPGFDAHGRMVVGHALFGSHGQFPEIFENYTVPGATAQRIGTLGEHYTQAMTASFDSDGHLYVTDMNRGRVLLYLNPGAPTTPTSAPSVIPTPATPQPKPTDAPTVGPNPKYLPRVDG